MKKLSKYTSDEILALLVGALVFILILGLINAVAIEWIKVLGGCP